MERVLDNLEVIPGQGWWLEPAKVLSDILLMMQRDPASTEQIKLRAGALVQTYEALKDEPISGSGLPSGIYDLPVADGATEIVTFINRWGKRGLEWARSGMRFSATGLANVLMEIRDQDLRQQAARYLLESEALDRPTAEAVAREAGVSDPGWRKHQARRLHDRELILGLLNSLDVPGTDVTAVTLRGLLDAGSDGLELLRRVRIPPGWTMQPDLVRRLTPILKSWRDTQSGWFPAELAMRLPQAQLLEVVRQLLASGDEEGPAIASQIVGAVGDPGAASELELEYLSAVVRARPLAFAARYWAVRSPADSLPLIHRPDEWVSCRVAHLQRSDEFDPSEILELIAYDASRQRHENLRQSFAQWALDRLDAISDPVRRAITRHQLGSAVLPDELDHLDAISDPVRRAITRHQLGNAPKPDELDACRASLERATADEGKELDGISVLPLLAATEPEARTRQLIDAFIASTSKDQFYGAISALGAAATIDNVRSTLHHALDWVTFTGNPTPPADYFLRLPDQERDTVFRDHVNMLKARGLVEDHRRFIEKIASVATPTFASQALSDLLQPEADHVFWRTAIVSLIERLEPEGADAFIGLVLGITKAYDDARFAEALIERLRPRERAAMLARTLKALSPSSARTALLNFCSKHPGLLNSNMIEEALRSAEIDSGLSLSWIADAPAASAKQRDRAWGTILKRARGGSASFEYAMKVLTEIVRLRHASGCTDADILDGVRSTASVIEEELSH
jgi:hypothetical protein